MCTLTILKDITKNVQDRFKDKLYILQVMTILRLQHKILSIWNGFIFHRGFNCSDSLKKNT